MAQSATEGCLALPPAYESIRRTLEKEYAPPQAQALARAMCEIDRGAPQAQVQDILARHFPQAQARNLARLLFMIAQAGKPHDQERSASGR